MITEARGGRHEQRIRDKSITMSFISFSLFLFVVLLDCCLLDSLLVLMQPNYKFHPPCIHNVTIPTDKDTGQTCGEILLASLASTPQIYIDGILTVAAHLPSLTIVRYTTSACSARRMQWEFQIARRIQKQTNAGSRTSHACLVFVLWILRSGGIS